MKLKDALEIGQECGLTDVGEAVLNIQMHAMNIFTYGEEKQELEELIKAVKDNDFKKDDLIKDCLNKLA